jgi:hypothetical protein
MPSGDWRPPPYVSEAGRGYLINAVRVRAALAHWRQVEQTGPPGRAGQSTGLSPSFGRWRVAVVTYSPRPPE